MRESASTRRFLDVEELASQRTFLAGLVEPALMPRLLEVVASTPSAIAYRIEFTRDASGRPRMLGRVEGMLPLTCQRCLKGLNWSFDAGFESLVIGSEHEETRGLDAVVCSSGRLELEPIIEDELLLALPNSPVHTPGSCESPPIGDTGEQPLLRRTNPFSALHALRSHHGRERSN
jgi:uncharacterized protein